MLLALTDHLRCTGAHEESSLVARADVVEMRRMIAGVLGCPVCHVERRVAGAVLYWSAGESPLPASAEVDVAGEELLRLAALIGLAESTSPFVLCGTRGLAAAGLGGIVEAPLVLLDPPDDRAAALATVIRGAPRVPLVPRSVRGVALDGVWATDGDRLASTVTALALRGRLVAPALTPMPAGVREIARDAREWVAERDADVVGLRRATTR